MKEKINPKQYQIGLIGAGNMAWQLGVNLQVAGFPISCVYSRTLAHAEELAHKLQCPSTNQLDDLSNYQPQLWLLCIADSAFEEVFPRLNLNENACLAHTSGSHAMEMLRQGHSTIGVFYPLQTMSKIKPVDFSKVPIFIEAEQKMMEEELQEVAQHLSPKVHIASSKARKRLHLAAVFACNFANHLWAITDDLLKEDGLSVNVLGHLIEETAQKALTMPPAQAQTGPAVREDQNIIQAHLEALSEHPDYQHIYRMVSEGIVEMKKRL